MPGEQPGGHRSRKPAVQLRPGCRRARGPRCRVGLPHLPPGVQAWTFGPARVPRPRPLESHLPARPWRAASGTAGSTRRRRPAPAVATRPRLPHSNIPASHWSARAGAWSLGSRLLRAGPRLLPCPQGRCLRQGFSNHPPRKPQLLWLAVLRVLHTFVPRQPHVGSHLVFLLRMPPRLLISSK